MSECRETGSRQFLHGKREVQNLRDPGYRGKQDPAGNKHYESATVKPVLSLSRV